MGIGSEDSLAGMSAKGSKNRGLGISMGGNHRHGKIGMGMQWGTVARLEREL